jgi:hypothetical protein
MLGLKKDAGQTRVRITKRLLGRILIDGDFITAHELETTLSRQKDTNDRIGEILVGMGALDRRELSAVLSIQNDLSSYEDAVKVAAGVRMLLGELLIKAKKITAKQLDLALQEQESTGKKLGEILVRRDLLLEYELETVLAFQRGQQSKAPGSSKLLLGELLVATGQISRKQLADVLKRQKVSKKKIGELLVEAGYAEPEQISQSLILQQKLVTAALVAALSISNLIGAVPEAHAGSNSFSSTISVSARVLERTTMNVISQASELVVTNSDIRQGYVDVPLASRVSVKTNNPAGYLLAFEVVVVDGSNGVFSGVNVRIGGREFQIPLHGGWIPQPFVRGGTVLDISYRFNLSENAQPGTYSWPIMVSVNRF